MPDDSSTANATTAAEARKQAAKPQGAAPKGYAPKHRLRFVTAAALFDGHDAAINIMRRILQAGGAEVIHLGHNRSVDEIVNAAIQEDAHGIAVSSYQGGHVEFFKYMVDLLRERGAGHIKVFGGGGGTIVPEEIRELHEYGVARIYSPHDGQAMGLQGMIADMLERADVEIATGPAPDIAALNPNHKRELARLITLVEAGKLDAKGEAALKAKAAQSRAPVIGITGTGGAGKSSLTDEIVRRFRLDQPDLAIAILAVDPTRRKSGGALLGDRIRMNAIEHPKVFMRSLGTRGSGSEVSEALPGAIAAVKAAGYDAVIVETSGIGQGAA
ncbi:MAG: cobalamin-dependent protein, partial [Alphaproteobacteria bacterium]